MKVKKFKNLWTMGLILMGAILVLFYIAKIFFPEFILGVAEVPSIVKFGNYVDTHKWAYHLYNFLFAYFSGYIYCCACCRTKFLNWKANVVLLSCITVLRVVSIFASTYYTALNYCFLLIIPFLSCLLNKNANKDTFISTCSCYIADILAQVLSLAIRNIVIMATSVNSATFSILFIDLVIWRVLFYLYFNHKVEKEE